MKTPVRIILTFFAVTASFYLILYLPSFLIPGAHINKLIHVFAALLIAAGIGVFFWKKSGSISDNQTKYILLGGIIVGAIGFISGFIGPIIIDPSANQGPLLGIFITGPLGFLAGLIGGGIYGLRK
jgi:hypothetical protein